MRAAASVHKLVYTYEYKCECAIKCACMHECTCIYAFNVCKYVLML